MSESEAAAQDLRSEAILKELEQITEDVTQALIHSDTKSLEDLVIKQIQWAKRLAVFSPDQIDKNRVLDLISRVNTQQQLVQQALSVTGVFLEGLNEVRAFNRLG